MSNPTDTPLAFKVKTTAPKLYCVRPNASVINPGESLQVSVILQGFAQPLPPDFKCKDKFLLVSLPSPELTDSSKVGESWANLEAKYKSQLVSKKLRVNYRFGADREDEGAQQDIANGKSNGVPTPAKQTNANRTMDETLLTPNQTFAANEPSSPQINEPIIPSAPVQQQVNPPQEFTSQPEVVQRATQPGAYHQPTQHQRPIGRSSPAQASPEIQRELDFLAEQVRSLSNKLDQNEKYASNERRARQFDAANEEPVNGISLPMALVLVLISFLLGWLVF